MNFTCISLESELREKVKRQEHMATKKAKQLTESPLPSKQSGLHLYTHFSHLEYFCSDDEFRLLAL